MNQLVMPSWLQAPDVDNDDEQPLPVAPIDDAATRLHTNRRNVVTVYPYILDHVLEQIAFGIPLRRVVEKDERRIDPAHFRAWIFSDPTRKEAYYKAQELSAEVIADELIEISDAVDSMETEGRSKLRMDSRKYILQVYNRKRFGDVKQMEIVQPKANEMDYDQLAMLIEGEFTTTTEVTTTL